MLRRALAGGVESSESFSEDAADSTPKDAAQRLEHYELVTDKDGQPVELGRGAMGVTYKAFDVGSALPGDCSKSSAKSISATRRGRSAQSGAFLRQTLLAQCR